jgi:hypothetical protein
MFPTWHIAVTSLVSAVVTALTLGGTAAWPGRQTGRPALADLIGVSLVAGLSVLLWRLGANMPTLNNDSIPGVSPADVLSAPVAYVAAGSYVRLRRVSGGVFQPLVIPPAVAAVVALVVNIVTI